MNKTNEGERSHRVYSNLLGPLDIIGRDCDHGNVESKKHIQKAFPMEIIYVWA